ncbi:N-acetylneuraminate synthase family protein [Chloroflexota bacterium]
MKDISKNDIENNIPLITRKMDYGKVKVNTLEIGGDRLTIIAGPCTVESKTQIFQTAQAAREAGAHMLRGGVFKPLTFPYGDPLGKADADTTEPSRERTDILTESEMFQKAEKRLAYLKEAGEKYNLPIVSEVVYSHSIKMMSQYVDMFQVGYRHMFNMDLIEALSRTAKPILLKRHYGESLRSLLGVAEHFVARGKRDLIFCERGIATAHTHNIESRAIIDIQAIPALKEYAPSVPVIVDPSHATFKRSYVAPISRAAIAAGADGILIEIHPDPENAWIDPLQSLDFQAFEKLVKEIEGIAKVLNKSI